MPNVDLPAVTYRELIDAIRTRTITLVDVLSPESYAAAHLPGAVNVPIAELARRAGTVIRDRDAPVVVYCGGPT